MQACLFFAIERGVAIKNGAARGLCCELRCKNSRRKDRLRCHTCESRRKRAKNPMRAAFRSLKDHAKARGILFRLSFVTFRKFALRSDYLNRRGNGKHCLTVDRIKNDKGYTPSNIQPLTREANSMKRMIWDAVRMERGMAWKEKYK